MKALTRMSSSIKVPEHNDQISEARPEPLAEQDFQSNITPEIETPQIEPAKIQPEIHTPKSATICHKHIEQKSEQISKKSEKTPNPNENSNNNVDLLSKLQLDISNTMKFRPPEEPEAIFSVSGHSKRKISQVKSPYLEMLKSWW